MMKRRFLLIPHIKTHFTNHLLKGFYVLLIVLITAFKSDGQVSTPFGFEDNAVGTWTGTSSSETALINSVSTNTRTGAYSMKLNTSSTGTGTKQWYTNDVYIGSANGIYIHFIYWAKAQDAGVTADASYRYSGSAPPVGSGSSSNASATFALTTTSWTRLTNNVQYNNATPRYYYPGPRKLTSVGATAIYMDDAVMYTSTSATTDIVDPATPTALTGTASGSTVNLAWTSATDAGTGVQATIVLRTAVAASAVPDLNDQATYSVTGGIDGPNVIGDWTVISTATGATATTYADNFVPNGTYKYAVILRDLAYNYSTAVVSPTVTVGSAPATPALTVNTTGFNGVFGNIVTGTNSTAQQFTVSGSNLTTDITVTAPAGFQVSTNSTTGYNTTATVTPVSGTVSNAIIYARFSPTAATGATGSLNITAASTGVTTQNIPVSGNALATEPATAGTITFGTTAATTMVVNLPTVGNGSRRIIVIRQSSAPTFTPTDAVAVTGVNASFTTATDQGSGSKVIYDGTGSGNGVVTVTGLTGGTQYYFAVYEYNVGTGTSQNYLLTPIATGNNTTVGILAPAIVINQTGFTSAFGNVVTGTSTVTPQQYTVSGANLTADITVTAPAGFGISTSSSGAYGTTLTLTQTAGIVLATPIYVKFSPTAATGATGPLNITHTSTGATTQNVAVSGNAIATEPTTAGTITFGTITANSIIVNLPTTGNGSKRIIVAHAASAVSYIPSDGTALTGVNAVFTTATDQGSGNKVIYDGAGTGSAVVTVTGLTSGIAYYFTVYEYNEGTGTSRNYLSTPAATGNATTIIPTPVITVTPGSFTGNFGNVVTGTNSTPQQYSVTGVNLTSGITITVPAGFGVSTTTNGTYNTTLTLAQSSGTVAATNIFIRYSPTAATGATGSLNITNTSTGSTTQNVAVNGNALATEPTTAGIITFGTITSNSIVVNLPTVGNGNKRIIVVKQGAAPTFTPTDAIAVTGVNTDFTLATDQGSGNKIIYDGSGSGSGLITLTGLTSGNQYYFMVYEYNVGTGTSQNYRLSPVATGNATTIIPVSTIVVTTSGFNGAFGNTVMGTSSAPRQYTVSGSALVTDITITAPSGFEIAINSSGVFSTTITLPQTGGVVATTPIYVRYSPALDNGATGNLNITNTSAPATAQNVTVSGNALSIEPTTIGSITFGAVTDSSIEVNLPTIGGGSRRFIVANLGAPAAFVPTDGAAVTGINTRFPLATDQGNGERIVYDGTGSGANVVKVTGLTAGMLYYFTVYEYNVGTGTSYNYLTNPAALNNMTTVLPGLGVRTHGLPGNVRIYPNPAKDVVNIEAAGNIRINVTDAAGRTIYRIENDRKVNISQLPDGIYLMTITTDKGQLLRAERILKANN